MNISWPPEAPPRGERVMRDMSCLRVRRDSNPRSRGHAEACAACLRMPVSLTRSPVSHEGTGGQMLVGVPVSCGFMARSTWVRGAFLRLCLRCGLAGVGLRNMLTPFQGLSVSLPRLA